MENKPIPCVLFSKDDSIALKGIAILLMLFHHCFMEKARYAGYNVSFWPFSEYTVVKLAWTSKICVSIYAFITGYGLFLSYWHYHGNATKWVVKRYINTFSGYWLVWILAAVFCQLIDSRTARLFFGDGIEKGLWLLTIDFAGLANFFETPTLNGTWWYMSAAFLFIILIPVIYVFKDNLPLVLIGVIFFLRTILGHDMKNIITTVGTSPYAFLTPFIIGTIFARYNLFQAWIQICNSSGAGVKIIKMLMELWIVIYGFLLYNKLPQLQFWEFHFGLYPLVCILFAVEFLLNLRFLRNILSILGKNSMNIFLTHTFVRLYYMADFTYSFHHFVAIIFMLLVVSLGISYLLEVVKKLIRYDMIKKWLLCKVG